MATKSTKLVLVCIIAASGLLGEAAQLMADHCAVVSPPFCRRCVPDNSGACCQDSGNCGCFYIQCLLPGAASGPIVPHLALLSPVAACSAPRLATLLTDAPEAESQPLPAKPAAGLPGAPNSKR